jgi:hypothetical protein
MSREDERPAELPTVSLADRDEVEARSYILLSGDLQSRGEGSGSAHGPARRRRPLTARLAGDDLEIQRWYWSPFSERWLSDPEAYVHLDAEEVRALRRLLATSSGERTPASPAEARAEGDPP